MAAGGVGWTGWEGKRSKALAKPSDLQKVGFEEDGENIKMDVVRRRGGRRSWEKFSGKRSSGPKPPQTVPTEKISSRSDLLVSILRSAELGSP
ncbi:hypothetical protein RUM43_009922 [Polyplax serrata]|uniref:Uncharacterized protein n=1 Tax=Polyplax serrata TaxID=468196 RepID=A0AAN8P3G0_POLSC